MVSPAAPDAVSVHAANNAVPAAVVPVPAATNTAAEPMVSPAAPDAVPVHAANNAAPAATNEASDAASADVPVPTA